MRFDDVEGLTAQISDQFGPWGPEVPITQDDINKFADLTGDHQWVHVDEDRAKASPLGTTIVHGFLLLAYLPKLKPGAGSEEITDYAAAFNAGGDKYRFVNMVPSGSTIHARGRIAAIEKKPNGVRVTTAYEIAVVGSTSPAVVGTLIVMYQ